MMELTAIPSYHYNPTDVSGDNGSIYYSDDEYDFKDEHAELKQSLLTMIAVVHSLVFVLGVLGNGVVIWVTGFKMKKTVNTVWLLNLAVADFLFTAFLPLGVVTIALDLHWPFGKFMCKLNGALYYLNMFASVYILMVISVDRCVLIVWPVWARNHRSVHKAYCVILGVWILALIFSTPYFIFKDTLSLNNIGVTICFHSYALSDDYETPSVNQLRQFRHQAMITSQFLLGFVVPFTVIVSCYAVIIHRIRRNRTLASQSSRPFKIIAAVITTFFLCWAPYYTMLLIVMDQSISSHQSETSSVITIWAPVFTCLAVLNSCLNPVLYVCMGQNFKDNVCKSIPKALETAFQEEVSGPRTDTKSVHTSQSKEMTTCDTAL
ncbi:chemerin-like receptor 1 [Epinephelus moara]|uniref:chemerin-like receptor 1 n=1 Tax=Epinephelus moara TaxID=300413 RepID=UPI00214E9A09|nr:chemerin-like receptor 1 [Epinephelus moara]